MDFDASRPIWHQLIDEFSRRIVVGAWAPGDRIAGVRELAAEFGVNPNTVQRALSELERDGLCRSERAVGRYVTDDPARIAALRHELAKGTADDFVRTAHGLGLTLTDATELVTERWKSHDTQPDTHTTTTGER
ncbi:MAG: GntR family transcriptional regulator [Dermatophilus congolensis]|nr:GntR family transcriptional regulator [Dermatophilus congolensis]